MREPLRYFQSNMQLLAYTCHALQQQLCRSLPVGTDVLLGMCRYARGVRPLLVCADMQFNAKWTYILCVLLFELGSAICGAAPSMDALIIGRAICGVAGSGMYVGVMTLLAATTTIHERPMYISSTGLT